jgi:hypothetical protein
MQSLKLRREKLNVKEHELRESLANFEKYINVNLFFFFFCKRKTTRILFRNLIPNECEHLNEHKMNVNLQH